MRDRQVNQVKQGISFTTSQRDEFPSIVPSDTTSVNSATLAEFVSYPV